MYSRFHHTRLFFSVILAVYALLSCDPLDSDSYTYTDAATSVTFCKAKLAGGMVLPGGIPKGLVFGLLYSTASDVSLDTATKLEAQEVEDNVGFYGFTVVADSLAPETKYYYRSYMLWKDKVFLGGVNQFTTLPVSSLIRTNAVTDIEVGAATLNATLDLSNCDYETVHYGFRLLPQISAETLYHSDNLSDGEFSCRVESLSSGQMYYVSAWVSLDGRVYTAEKVAFVTQLEHKPEAVDMGLSVKWASFNVGADKPEEFGDSYAWGELSVKPKYEWDTYIFYGKTPGASVFDITNKYCREDQKTVLENIDDVASVKLGGSWRMPTVDEWDELLNKDNCSWTWTTQNDANGYLVSSNTTGNTIFLRGDRHYWSSTCHPSNYQSAYALKINQSQRSLRVFYRYYGYAVRPVCD